MHSYLLSAPALFICVCESGCSPVCMVRQCVYLFMSSVWVLSLHHPTVSAETELAVKTGMKLWWGRKKKRKRQKKKAQQLWDISILAPRFPQAACRRLQNGCAPCHRVGSALSKRLWMENTDCKVSSLLPLPPLFFSPSSPLASSLSVHPSSLIERASHPHQRGFHWLLPLLREKLALPLPLPFAGALPELSVSAR